METTDKQLDEQLRERCLQMVLQISHTDPFSASSQNIREQAEMLFNYIKTGQTK